MASEKMNAAAQLFASGMTMSDIAKELNVSAATVRSWKARGVFDGVATQQHKRNVAIERCNDRMQRLVEENDELTEKQKLFCLFYSKSLNGASAYRRAYPDANYQTACTGAYDLLRQPKIRDEVARLKQIRTDALLVDGDDIVERMMRIAFADMSEFVVWSHTGDTNEIRFVDSKDVDGTLVTEIKKGRDGASVKLADRMKALEWLAEYFGLEYKDKDNKESVAVIIDV